ncbi:transcriptional regulator [Actinoplanes ianthinogenes]|uniref:Transcriptional regulator n=1 Tax=Actinoplanes ianthinogenes TaxID=122358 RepID=A0ABM7LNF0_9ACTN|nr:helix-turn-helix domain-containing protein [Actinoplanes ianthinogenes]BCJ40808.1 transcriptional regulator [Actinoplanes ianthinogenes]GGR25060.1 transcriptional regulator [Actinoplanes ianthinogenes]
MDTTVDVPGCDGADAYLRDCPSRTVLDVLASKWVALIVPTLRGGPVRFGALRRRLDGITQKTLTQTLRNLERDGLITRTVHPTSPPQVDYALTELGRSACDLLEQLRLWSETNLPRVLAARARSDAEGTYT